MVADKTTAATNYGRMKSNCRTHPSLFPQHLINTIFVILIIVISFNISVLIITAVMAYIAGAATGQDADRDAQAFVPAESKRSSLARRQHQTSQKTPLLWQMYHSHTTRTSPPVTTKQSPRHQGNLILDKTTVVTYSYGRRRISLIIRRNCTCCYRADTEPQGTPERPHGAPAAPDDPPVEAGDIIHRLQTLELKESCAVQGAS